MIVVLSLAIASLSSIVGCAPARSQSSYTVGTVESGSEAAQDVPTTPSVSESAVEEKHREENEFLARRMPLEWNVDEAQLVMRQGSTSLWGSCGECCIASTLNLVTGSAYTEADIVDYVVSRGLCDPSTGGMTLDDMADAYAGLLPLDRMDVFGYAGDYAPTLDDMASCIESGIILNAAVYGEMMREGGHTGEGEVHSTHWIVVHSVSRAEDGSVAGFGILDSASDADYLTAERFAEVYYGYDGTTIIDPACVLVFGCD